jgi:hypothetical protein
MMEIGFPSIYFRILLLLKHQENVLGTTFLNNKQTIDEKSVLS